MPRYSESMSMSFISYSLTLSCAAEG
jgi:hypothetical protein